MLREICAAQRLAPKDRRRPDASRRKGSQQPERPGASQLGLPALADSGYDDAGQGVHTPVKQPGGGHVLAPDNQTYNTLLRTVRCREERGFALLVGRWRALRRINVSASRIGDYVKAALVLTHIEQVQLRATCVMVVDLLLNS
jgi:DDE superfamily endonuclease